MPNQAAIAISSVQSEYYRVVKAGSMSLRIKAMSSELGLEFEGPIELDADAAAQSE